MFISSASNELCYDVNASFGDGHHTPPPTKKNFSLVIPRQKKSLGFMSEIELFAGDAAAVKCSSLGSCSWGSVGLSSLFCFLFVSALGFVAFMLSVEV